MIHSLGVIPIQSAKSYQHDLLKQMKFQQELRESEEEQAKKELEMAKNEEILYKQRFQSALEAQWTKKMHPRRAQK